MQMTPITRSSFLKTFVCLGAECEDTCCKGWGMQVDQATKARYEKDAPELLDAIASGEADIIMKRDPATDYCVKFTDGLCGIHATRGTDYLGDACHFYPRVTRGLGNAVTMTAALSCPEVVRLAVMREGGFAPDAASADRVPYSLKNYLPAELKAEDALAIHQFFLDAAGDADLSPEAIIARLASVARSLEKVEMASWPMAAGFYWKNAASRIPAAEPLPADVFNLLHALSGLLSASKKTARPRLDQTIRDMEKALDVTLDWEKLSIRTSDKSWQFYQSMAAQWRAEWSFNYAPILRRWTQSQLSLALFPFAGFGATLSERITIIGVRFATLKLALMSALSVQGGGLSENETVRIIQSLSRFLDHLADPTLSMEIYKETGWVRESRLRALIGDE